MNDQQPASPEGNELKTSSGGSPLDKLTGMPEQTLLLIVWGSLGLLLISIFMPWLSASGSGGGQSFGASVNGLHFGLGWVALLCCIASGTFSFMGNLKQFCGGPAALAFAVSLIYVISPPASVSASSGYASASVGAGFGVYLSIIAALGATVGGLGLFLKLKNQTGSQT